MGIGLEHAQFQPEYELLRLCSRTILSSVNQERIKMLAHADIKWDYLLQLGAFHRVLPLLNKSLMDSCRDVLPPGINDKLVKLGNTTSIYNKFLVKELSRLLSLFETKNIPSIVLKGPVLAQSAYGDIDLRNCIDLDILIPNTDFQRSKSLLVSNGYAPHAKVTALKGIREKLYVWQSGQYPFRRGAHVFNVDLHTSVMPPLYYYNADFEALYRRSEIISVAGTRVRGCGSEDVLQILCYHGAKNRWERLKHICDVTELLRSCLELDWDAVLRVARDTRGERILLLGLYLAITLFDTPLPNEVSRRVNQDRCVDRIGTRLIESLSEKMLTGTAGIGERLRFHFAIQDSFVTKARYGFFVLVRRLWDLFRLNGNQEEVAAIFE